MAVRHRDEIGRAVVAFLDKRYADDGAEFKPMDLLDAAGPKIGVLNAAVAKERDFKPPVKPAPTTMKIQYDAKTSAVRKIAAHLRRPGMTGSEVGRYTFSYFLKNEVGAEE